MDAPLELQRAGAAIWRHPSERQPESLLDGSRQRWPRVHDAQTSLQTRLRQPLDRYDPQQILHGRRESLIERD